MRSQLDQHVRSQGKDLLLGTLSRKLFWNLMYDFNYILVNQISKQISTKIYLLYYDNEYVYMEIKDEQI